MYLDCTSQLIFHLRIVSRLIRIPTRRFDFYSTARYDSRGRNLERVLILLKLEMCRDRKLRIVHYSYYCPSPEDRKNCCIEAVWLNTSWPNLQRADHWESVTDKKLSQETLEQYVTVHNIDSCRQTVLFHTVIYVWYLTKPLRSTFISEASWEKKHMATGEHLFSSFTWSLESLFASTSANSVELHRKRVILRPRRIHLRE